MNDFDPRWQALALTARLHPADIPADLPTGFATRVLALARQPSAEAWEDVLTFLSLRAVLATACLFLLSAGFAFADWLDPRIEPPALEKTVTSQLPWP